MYIANINMRMAARLHFALRNQITEDMGAHIFTWAVGMAIHSLHDRSCSNTNT